MRCDEYKEMLSAYIDNELGALEQAELEDHLWNCPECRAALADLQAAGEALDKRPMAEVPADIEAAILARVKHSADKTSTRRRIFGGAYRVPRPLAWATCLLLLLLAGNSVYMALNVGAGRTGQTISEPTEARVQKIVLSRADVVSVRTVVGDDDEM